MKKSRLQQQQQQVTIQQAKFHHGPLPSPDALEHYERIQPGFAQRIITLAEDEAKHRRSIDVSVVKMNYRLSWVGIISGLLAISGVLALCYYAFSLGHATQAASIAVGVLVSIGGVFLYRRSSNG